MNEERTNKNKENRGRPKLISGIFEKLEEFIKASQEEVKEGREEIKRLGRSNN